MSKLTIDETHTTRGRHASVEIKADPLEHDFDEVELGRGPAQAIRDAIATGIRGIRERAKPATIRKREQARAALARGEAWAVERYRGRQPGQSDRLFNDSGALADLAVRQGRDGWEVTTPSHRPLLAPRDFDSGAFAAMMRRLRELVPAIEDPTGDPKVREAIEASAGRVVRKRR